MLEIQRLGLVAEHRLFRKLSHAKADFIRRRVYIYIYININTHFSGGIYWEWPRTILRRLHHDLRFRVTYVTNNGGDDSPYFCALAIVCCLYPRFSPFCVCLFACLFFGVLRLRQLWSWPRNSLISSNRCTKRQADSKRRLLISPAQNQPFPVVLNTAQLPAQHFYCAVQQ